MADEWRVSLNFYGGSRYQRATLRDLLRSRVGDGIVISAEKSHVYLYAGTAEAADEAARTASEVLAQQNVGAGLLVERWDPSAEAWRDERTGAPSAADLEVARPSRLRSAADVLIEATVSGYLDCLPP